MSDPGEADPKIVEAIEWFASYRGDRSRPSVPLLRERFGLSVAEACSVLREVNLRRARAT
ncbi:hypothetical protein [Mesorhizobium sp. M4B.F.Ca.ET.013.02.1.1]|uniref:hypothetical protein n=1 Tax=Mesorhizobium sp. M4B.F.Ca.ET.013.02.1.1 TaxID=2496755 RepID=UPI000FD3E5CC|nr:hypothetical protein [Mesorhizobium sp. M4B.F.Ca.ET.013.02.1.1]RUW24624.1 hypothetical protein EOA34_14345 [Mesorhizobium sp. M4B.F.Ca.ET.013.02.1.1]